LTIAPRRPVVLEALRGDGWMKSSQGQGAGAP